MKLHLAAATDQNLITGYGSGHVMINKVRHEGSLIVLPETLVTDWGVDAFETLDETHFERLAALRPEVALLGTGARLRFPHPRLTAALAAAGIGLEVMDTGAACRTYNILLGEGRRVAAALLPA